MNPGQSDISQIKIGRHTYGIVGLKNALEALGETHAKQPDEAVANELLRRLSKENYIPDQAQEKYGRAFVREFRKYLGQPFDEEKSESLEIKVLGAGGTVCDGMESQIIEAISKIGFWFKIAAEPCFHAKPDDASILFFLKVRLKPEVRRRRRPKDIFEIASDDLEVYYGRMW